MLINDELGRSDKAWNMLPISPQLHRYWSKPYWAIKFIGITPLYQGPEEADVKQIVTMRFQWLRHKNGDPKRHINVDNNNDCQIMLDGLASDSITCLGFEGMVTAHCGRSNQPIVSGQDFNVVLDTVEDADKMKKMLEIQWACITIAAMCGAAGPRDDSNDDLSEFDFEREEYEWRQFIDPEEEDSSN